MSRKVKVVFTGSMSKLRASVLRARQTIRKFALRAKASLQSVARSIKRISFAAFRAGALGAAAAVTAIAAAGIKGVKLAADMETLTTSFEVLTGSAETARKTIKSLDDLSNSTPLAPEDVISAGQKLIAFGENADTVTATVARLGDVSSGIGAPLGEIAEIYGKARVQGTLFSEDINQLAGRGIPIFESLASVMGVAAGDIKKMASQGKIGFKDLESAFVQMTGSGGKFENMMAKQSGTFNGMLSTMFGKLRAKLRDAFTPVMENLKPVLESVIAKIDTLTPHITAAAQALGDVVRLTAAAFGQGKVFAIGGSVLKIAVIEAANFLWKAINGAAVGFASQMKNSVVFLSKTLSNGSFWHGVVLVFKGIGEALIATAFRMASILDPTQGTTRQAERYERLASGSFKASGRQFSDSGVVDNYKSYAGSVMKDVMSAVSSTGDIFDSSKSKEDLAMIIQDLRDGLPVLKAAAKDSPTSALPANSDPAVTTKGAKSAGSFADSKARVGGGGRIFSADNRALAEQKRQTRLQERTAKATETMATAPPSTLTATYA